MYLTFLQYSIYFSTVLSYCSFFRKGSLDQIFKHQKLLNCKFYQFTILWVRIFRCPAAITPRPSPAPSGRQVDTVSTRGDKKAGRQVGTRQVHSRQVARYTVHRPHMLRCSRQTTWLSPHTWVVGGGGGSRGGGGGG